MATLTPQTLAALYPRLYHMATFGSWPSIAKHGLLSTTALLDLFGIIGEKRRQIESCHRPESVLISHPLHGEAEVRDQKPMSIDALGGCLEGMEPPEFLQLLNNKVFFWPTIERLNRMLGARAYKTKPHCVITVDTAALLARHGYRVVLSRINSGSTLYTPPKRGIRTFQSIEEYPVFTRRSGVACSVAEVAINSGVPDIAEIVIQVDHRTTCGTLEILFSR